MFVSGLVSGLVSGPPALRLWSCELLWLVLVSVLALGLASGLALW